MSFCERPEYRFTDDTVLTIAVADSMLHGGDLVDLFKAYARFRNISRKKRVRYTETLGELRADLGADLALAV